MSVAPPPFPSEDEECKHGLDLAFCSWCNPSSTAARRHDPDDGPTVNARYPGRCRGCGGRISEGDTLHLADGEWLCEECP